MLKRKKKSISTLPIAIVAHPARMSLAESLSHKVDAEIVSVDEDSQGAESNHLQALTWLKDCDSEWAIVLEDDSVPVLHFRDQAMKALAVAPTPIVSFYIGRGRPPQWQQSISAAVGQALQTDANWVVGTHLLHAVGYAIKTELIPSALAHPIPRDDQNMQPLGVDYVLHRDVPLCRWAYTHEHKVSYAWPSLIEHRHTLPTLITACEDHKGTEARRAWQVGRREAWDSSFVELPGYERIFIEQP